MTTPNQRSLPKRMLHGLGLVLVGGIFYWIFLGALGTYLYQRHLYRDVEHWPSVPASDIRTGSGGGGFPVTTRDGHSFTTSPVHWAQFSYEVNGRRFRRELSSGDRTKFTGPWDFFPAAVQGPRAYYHPQHPEIAVLSPRPYRSDLLEGLIAVSGLLVVLHLFFTLRREA